MKKPFVSLKSRGDFVRLLLSVVMLGFSISLFFVKREVTVFASGTSEGVRGLFNLVSSWL